MAKMRAWLELQVTTVANPSALTTLQVKRSKHQGYFLVYQNNIKMAGVHYTSKALVVKYFNPDIFGPLDIEAVLKDMAGVPVRSAIKNIRPMVVSHYHPSEVLLDNIERGLNNILSVTEGDEDEEGDDS